MVVAELGPGRGTLMADALRAWRSVPEFLDGISIALVETSPVLRETQANTLRGSPAPPQWCESIEDVPQGPLILIANEFIDALPVRQFVRAPNAWHERCVALSDKSGFVFCAGAPVEPEAVPQSLNAMTMAEGDDRRDAPRDLVSARGRSPRGRRTRQSPHSLSITAMPRAASATRCKRSGTIASPIPSPRRAKPTSPRMSISPR